MWYETILNTIIIYLYNMFRPGLFLAPGLALAIWAHRRARRGLIGPDQEDGMTGAEVAGLVLAATTDGRTTIHQGEGPLGTMYDPRRRQLRLAPAVFEGRSPAAQARAAHEAGHASSHRWLATLRVAALFGTGLSELAAWLFIVAGFAYSFAELATGGVRLYLATLAALAVLLPLEFRANRRVQNVWNGPGLDSIPFGFMGATLPIPGRSRWPLSTRRPTRRKNPQPSEA